MPEEIFVTQAAYDALSIMHREMTERGVKHAAFPSATPRREQIIIELTYRKRAIKKKNFKEDNKYMYGFSVPFECIKVAEKMHWSMQRRLEREAAAREKTGKLQVPNSDRPKREIISITKERASMSTALELPDKQPDSMPPLLINTMPLLSSPPSFRIVAEFVRAVDEGVEIMMSDRARNISDRIIAIKANLVAATGEMENSLIKELTTIHAERERITDGVLREVLNMISTESRFVAYEWTRLISFPSQK